MLDTRSVVAIIPARGGSKRLPDKNIRLLNGKPLVAWTIEAALESAIVDHVLVTTDSPEIADIARGCGADVPFIRPAALATDEATSRDVVVHALEYLRDAGKEADVAILLQPTSPLRGGRHIDEAGALYLARDARTVLAVCQCAHNPLWSNKLPDDLSLHEFIEPAYVGARGQDLPPYYRINGSTYFYNARDYMDPAYDPFDERSFAYVMDDLSSVDIDTLNDFFVAEACMAVLQNDK